jgi:heme-degrading monooxygenase HmoA
MPVTELAKLTLHPGVEASSPTLHANLLTAKLAMEKSSGFTFHYYQCVEDANVIYILGSWPSVKFHMQEFIPSQANQELLALLKDQLTVEWMFHVGIDQTAHPLPLSRKMVAIGRHFIKHGEKDKFWNTFSENKHELENFVGEGGKVVGAWRVDKGYDPSSEDDGVKDEFVLFTPWDSVEHHFEFAKTERFKRYSRITGHIEGAEIKHATLLEVGEE